MTVYLLHFHRALGNPDNRRAQARHYLGWTLDLDARLAEHRAGRGAAIMAACAARGVGWTLARTWEGGRDLERRLKRWHKARQLCPICRLAAAPPPMHM